MTYYTESPCEQLAGQRHQLGTQPLGITDRARKEIEFIRGVVTEAEARRCGIFVGPRATERALHLAAEIRAERRCGARVGPLSTIEQHILRNGIAV